ncbi:hypothetical protein ACC674_06220 [Rhizobium ruizarguesonis]
MTPDSSSLTIFGDGCRRKNGEMQMRKYAQMSMQEIAGFLLSDHEVTDGVTENVPAEEMISVTDSAPKTPEKRKRGRPSKTGGAMTAAERARRYRQKHRPARQELSVELWAPTIERAEKIAAERRCSIASVIDYALDERSVKLHPAHFKLVKAAAAKADRDLEFMVLVALSKIRDEQWAEIAESWGHHQ